MNINGVNAEVKVDKNIKPQTGNEAQKTDTDQTYKGFTFHKSSGDSIEVTTSQEYSAEASGSADADTKKANNILSQLRDFISGGDSTQNDGKSKQSSSVDVHNNSNATVENSINNMNNAASDMETESSNFEKHTSKLGSLTEKQNNIRAWIENNSPSVEEMANQVRELQTEGLSIIADAGIQEEFGSFDEAVAKIQEMIDPDVMEQIAQKQEELQAKIEARDEKQQKYDSLAEDDPEKAALGQELEQLDTEIGVDQAEIDGMNQTDSGLTMTELSELMTNLQDVMGAIDTLNESINSYVAELDVKEESAHELDTKTASVNKEVQTSNKNLEKANNSMTVSQKTAEQSVQKDIQTTNDLLDAGKIVTVVGQVGGALSTVGISLGKAFMSNPYTAAVGGTLQTVGGVGTGISNSVTTVGNGMTTIGQAQLDEANGNASSSDTTLKTVSAIAGTVAGVAQGTAGAVTTAAQSSSNTQNAANNSRQKVTT